VVSVPPAPADFAQFSTIAIVFNKLLDGKTVQPCPDQNTTTPVASTLCPTPPPPANLVVEVGPVGGPLVDLTADHEVIYYPNNAQLVLGASILVQPVTGDPLPPATQYHVVGTVKDQQGNTANVDVTVITAP
jgi:hypothetical protein